MGDSAFLFITIFIVTLLIYFLYRIMLASEENNDDVELQITSADVVEQLNILRHQKKYNIAENLAKKYLERRQKDDDVRVALAKILKDSSRAYEAIEQIKIVLKRQPKNNKLKNLLANLYVKVEKPMRAIDFYLEILDEDPEDAVAIKELAQTYFDTNQKKSAMKMYERLLNYVENIQEKARIRSIIAEIHVVFMEYAFAIQEYNEVLELFPDDISIKKRLVELYRQISDTDSVIGLANSVYELHPIDSEGLWALQVLVETYRHLHDWDKALEFANLVEIHPLADSIETGEVIANILLEKEQVDESIQMLRELIGRSPKNVELRKSLAKAYERKYDYDSAVAVYKKILDDVDAKQMKSIHMELSSLYSNWAMYLFENDDTEECFKKFITALQYYDSNPDIYYRLGNVNREIKNNNEAIAQYKRAIELDPRNAEYYYCLADCYEQIGSMYEQKKVLIESLIYNDTSPEVYYKLGIIFQTQNDINSAISKFKKAIELNDNYVEAKCKLALIYEHIGNKDDAIILYEDILMIDPENEEVINNLNMLTS